MPFPNIFSPILINFWFICCLVVPATGQLLVLPDEPIAQRTSGEIGQDDLVAIAANWRGDIATIGNAARGNQGGQDISLVVYDAQLNKILERHIGRQSDDGAGQIVALPDGRYAIAGFSTQPKQKIKTKAMYRGKRDGWLLLINEKGETEKEIILGTPENDELVDLDVCPDGSLWVCGNSANRGWVLKLDTAFNVVWEQKTQPFINIAAATRSADGSCFIIGSIEKNGRKQMWMTAFDELGHSIMEKSFDAGQAEAGVAIIALTDSTLAVAGNVYHPVERENAFVCTLNHKGTILNYQSLGGREFDKAHALLRLQKGQLLVAGGSASFERGSRRISAWFSQWDVDLNRQEDKYYGSKLDDEVLSLIEHPDGRLLAVGTTARQILKMRQGWIFQLTDRADRKTKTSKLNPSIGSVSPGLIQPVVSKDRIFIPYTLENKSEKTQYNLRAVVTVDSFSSDDLFRLPGSRSVLLPPIAGNSSMEWGIPLQFKERTISGNYKIKVQFFQDQTPIGTTLEVDFALAPDPQPILNIGLTYPDSGFISGREGFVQVEVRNAGNETAKSVSLQINQVAGVILPAQITLGDLAAGSKITYKMTVKPENIAIGPKALPLHVRVADAGLVYTAVAEAEIGVSAPSPTPVQSKAQDYTVAVWVFPNPDNFDHKDLVWAQEEMTVQIKIVSNQPVTRQHFCLEVNGQPCVTGTKFDEVQIKGDRNSKTFSQAVKLKEGDNTLKVKIQGAAGVVNCDSLLVKYFPSKPNLHIVSIGVPASDLKYTCKDASDFASSISAKPNRAFGKIFLDTLLNEDNTTKTEIMKSLRRLQYRYADLQIQPKDLLVIFISGHGIGAYDGSFRLAASDFDSPFIEETSLDFEQDIVNYLHSLPCRKLFLIDACHSGVASGEGLAGIAARKTGLNMLLSCQANEFSYEDDTWGNGAFTRALVSGIETFVNNPGMLDKNNDAALDVTELFKYIQKEVPALVDKKKPKPKTAQLPHLITVDTGRPMVIYSLKN